MDFPRPNPDTGFGFHDSASSYWKPDDYPSYARMLREHGATWFLMWTWDEKKAPWARALIEAGIMPIVRLGPAKMPRPNIDMAVVDAYIAAGVKWFVLGNEYNLHEEWEPDDHWKGIDKPIRHVAEWFVRISGEITAKGGWCLTPPPALGGHWLHRDWFIRLLTALRNIATERGVPFDNTPGGLLWHCGIGIHCRSAGNPLEDGPEDYDVSAREWEEADRMVKEFVGHSLPMANTEWGDEPNWCKRLNPEFSNPQKWAWWESRNIEQIQWCNPANDGPRYPDYVFANTLWILHSAAPWEDCSLIHNHPYLAEMGGSDITPLWDALPGLVTWNRAGAQPIPPIPEPPSPEPPVVKLRVYDMHGQTQDYDWAHAKYGIRITPLEGVGWHVTQLREISGPAGVECYIYDEDGLPEPDARVAFRWPDGEQVKYTEASGKAGFAYGPGSYITDPVAGGPHRIIVTSERFCDKVEGLGMLAGTFHDHLDLVYQWGLVSPQQPEPPVEPPVGPDIPYTLKNALNERLKAAGLPPITDMRPAISKYVDHDAVGTRGLGPESLWNITFHHLPTLEACLEDDILEVAYYHTQTKGWSDIAYDFMVGSENDRGEVPTFFTGYLIHYSPQSGNGRVNKYSISVAVHGDFTEESPTAAQLDALRCIVESLEEFVGGGRGQCHPLPIIRHKDLVATDCPGNLYEVYRRHLNK